MKEFNNKIVIIKDEIKDSFLSRMDELINVKIITLSELKKKFYFDYEKEALYFIADKYSVVYDVAKKYIESIYYINDDVKSNKIDFLNQLKKELIDNNLIFYNDFFHNFIKNKEIILYNLEFVDKFYKNIFDEISKYSSVSYYNDNNRYTKKDIYEANNSKEEISFVAYKICELISNGVDINNIKIINVTDDYYFDLIKIFKMFNIPVNINSSENILGSKIVNEFLNNYYSDINKSIDVISKLIENEEDEYIYNSIIKVLNSYYFIDDYEKIKSFVMEDLSNIKVKSHKYKNAVEVCDLDDICDNNYAFLINFNEGIYPHKYKDEDYLSDKEKSLLNISTSNELNKLNSDYYLELIKNIKNLIVSYSSYNLKGKIYVSSLYNEEVFNLKYVELNYNYSNNFNKISLLKYNDEYNKYGTESDIYNKLLSHYGYNYLTYDNKYKIIDDNLFKDNPLVLSYTSLNCFNECNFKYYLSNVLKLNKFENSFDTIIGNIYHKILSECFVDEYDIIKSYDEEVLKYSNKYDFSESDKYFLDILKNELVLVVDILKNQLNYTLLKKSMYEKEILIDIDKNNKVMFKGFIDKILYDDFDNECVCVIIDYKTGNPKLNIDNAYYGLEMQLPVYIYLIKNSNIIYNARIGGFYLQKILNNEVVVDKKIESLKLQGYSNSDMDVINKVDISYTNSEIIKSLKTNNDGSFSSYSKIINDDEIDFLNNIVDKKIKEASNMILSNHFDINPKKIKDKNYGCEYCNYKDICYMKNDDIVTLKKIDNIFEMEEK